VPDGREVTAEKGTTHTGTTAETLAETDRDRGPNVVDRTTEGPHPEATQTTVAELFPVGKTGIEQLIGQSQIPKVRATDQAHQIHPSTNQFY